MLTALLAAVLPLAPQDSPVVADSLLRAAPDGTLMAVACEDVPGLVAGLRAGPFGVLWEDQALAPLRAQVDEALAEVWEQEAYPGGPTGSELLAGLEAAAMFLGGEFEDDEPTVGAFALAVRDDLAHELAAMLAAEAGTSELVVVGGLEFQLTQDEEDGDWLVAGEWLRGLVFAFGSERERALTWAHALVVALEADAQAATPLGAQLVRRAGARSSLEMHIDAGGLARQVLAEADPAEAAVLERLGISGLGWASATLGSLEGGALELSVTVQVAPEVLVGQWLSLMRPAPLDLGRLAPPGTIEASFAGMDADGLWRGTQAFLAELDPASEDDGQGPAPAELLEQRLDEVEALIGIDLREAVFENLTGAFARFVLPDDVAYAHAPDAPLGAVDTLVAYLSGGLPQVGAVQVVGLRDGSAMEDLIDALIALAGADGRIVEEQVGEHWMQTLELEMLPFPGVSPCWAVLDDALLISAGPPSLRAVLTQASAEDARSWLDGPRARRARTLVEEGATLVTVADLPALARRRMLRPLREFDAGLDSKAYGATIAAALQSVVPAGEGEHAAAMERFRGQLQQAIQAGERLCADGLSGDWLSTLTWSRGEVRYRSWTEPAKRD